jgi:hypothetical protein
VVDPDRRPVRPRGDHPQQPALGRVRVHDRGADPAHLAHEAATARRSRSGVTRRGISTALTGDPLASAEGMQVLAGRGEGVHLRNPRAFMYPTWPRRKVSDMGMVVTCSRGRS